MNSELAVLWAIATAIWLLFGVFLCIVIGRWLADTFFGRTPGGRK